MQDADLASGHELEIRHQFLVLDSWRGICALLVALGHFPVVAILFDYAISGYTWLFVDFFFVLSGFVITYAYENKIHSGASVAEFVIRRFGRLWPLHAAVLAAFVLFELVKLILVMVNGAHPNVSAFSGQTAPQSIVTNLLLIQSLGIKSESSWNEASWSISTEFWTCLLFGSFCFLSSQTAHRRETLLAASVAIIITSAGVLIWHSANGMRSTVDYGVFRCTYGFFIGHLTYHAWQKIDIPAAWVKFIELAAVLTCLLFVCMASHAVTNYFAPFAFGIAVLIFAHENGPISRLLLTRLWREIGKRSYSIYMIHLLVMQEVFVRPLVLGRSLLEISPFLPIGRGKDGQSVFLIRMNPPIIGDLMVLGYLVAVVAMSAITYKFIEEPGRLYFNRLAVHVKNRIPMSAV